MARTGRGFPLRATLPQRAVRGVGVVPAALTLQSIAAVATVSNLVITTGGTSPGNPVFVASTSKGGSANGVTSDPIDTTGADLIVVVSSYYTAGTSVGVTDSKSNTYTGLTLKDQGSPVARIWYVLNPTVGTGHTFTVSATGGYPSVHVAAFSGMKDTAVFDQQNGATGTGTSLATGSVTPSEDGELVIAGICDTVAGARTMTGYTINQVNYSAGNFMGGGLAYKIQTTAGAENPSWAWSGSQPAAAVIATFKSEPVAGGAAELELQSIDGVAAVSNMVVGTPKLNLDVVAAVASVTNLVVGTPRLNLDAIAGIASVSNLVVGTPRLNLDTIAGVSSVSNLVVAAPALLALDAIAGVASLSNVLVSAPTVLVLSTIAGLSDVANITVGSPRLTLQTIVAISTVSAFVDSPGTAVLNLGTVEGIAAVSNLLISAPTFLQLDAIAGVASVSNVLLQARAILALSTIEGVAALANVLIQAPTYLALGSVDAVSSVSNLTVGTPSLTLQAIVGVSVVSILVSSPATLSLSTILAISTVTVLLTTPSSTRAFTIGLFADYTPYRRNSADYTPILRLEADYVPYRRLKGDA